MGKLDSGQCNGRTPERLEASHRGASAFDRSMILLNEIGEVLATPGSAEVIAESWPQEQEAVRTGIDGVRRGGGR